MNDYNIRIPKSLQNESGEDPHFQMICNHHVWLKRQQTIKNDEYNCLIYNF